MSMEYYTFKKLTVAGIPNAILSITGYTGSGGCEVYVANKDGVKLWDAILLQVRVRYQAYWLGST